MELLPGHALRAPEVAGRRLRTESDGDQRRRIARAVAEPVSKRGFHGTRIEHIVKNANVGYGTFYKHFETKEDAFVALLDLSTDKALRRIGQAFVDAQGGWHEQVAASLRAFLRLVVEEPVVTRACLVEAFTAGPNAIARYDRALDGVVPLLTPGRKCRPGNERLPGTLEISLANSVVWMVYQRLIVGELGQIESLLPEALEFVLRPYLGEREAARIAKGTEVQKSEG